jgi:cytochrome oxidase Cu insertion factor (SCO1/SenC/PrrC family)
MPSTAPLISLGHPLSALLLNSLLWLAVAAVVVGAAVWLLERRGSPAFARAHRAVFGPAGGPAEPAGRRFLRISVGGLWIVDGLLQAQPDMPAGFVRNMIAPGAAASPPWLAALVNPLADIWTRHPVVADAATVWVQVGLGVLILVGGRGILARVTLWASVGWSLLVWVVGEFLGGLLAPGASWLVGAPGAVLVYAIAGLLLLAPDGWWRSGRCALLARRSVAVWVLLGALLQALPWEGSWSAAGLSAPFVRALGSNQPELLLKPISWANSMALSRPITLNATIVAVLVIVGLTLLVSGSRAVIAVGFVVFAVTWWVGQDFGVLGGIGTDPNTALPLALLLASSLPRWAGSPATEPAVMGATTRKARQPLMAGFSVLGVGAAFVAPLLVVATLTGPASAAAVEVDAGGGVVSIPHRSNPQFSLTDQRGDVISSADLKGKLTLVTFLDPECSDECPIIANQLAETDRELGPLAAQIQILALDTNPVFHRVADVAAFTTSHGLDDLPNWHYLAGPAQTIQTLLNSYGIGVAVPSVGMISHGEGVYFIGPDGTEEAYIGDGANAGLTASYAVAFRDEVRRLLQ